MALLPRSQMLKESSRRQFVFAVVTLIFSAALICFPFRTFGWMVAVLPWLWILSGVYTLLRALAEKNNFGVRVQRYRRRRLLALGTVALTGGIVLLIKTHWCDVVLWYCFAGLVALAAVNLLRMAFMATAERHFWWRFLGGGTALVFAALMLLKPRSGLSDALELMGYFSLAWGIFQLALPRFKD